VGAGASQAAVTVRAAIEHQLRWTEQHPELARFVYMRGHLEADTPGGSELASLNRELAGAFREWMQPLLQRGEVRPMPMVLLSAIVGGPAHAIARRWLAGQLDRAPTEFVGELADAATAALRGKPARAGERRPPQARTGRITIELFSDDGGALALGEATADLTPTFTRSTA
jgi:hypothetical protein